MSSPNGGYLLFLAGLDGTQRSIGIARSSSPLGPWTLERTPILTTTAGGPDAEGTLAPSVLYDNGKLRMWYLAYSIVSGTPYYQVGYAESE